MFVTRSIRTSYRALRLYSSKAFVLDIDGVLLRGSKAIPEAPKALELMNRNKIPWVLVTNGGGKTEKERVQDLSAKFGGSIDISEKQILQSHTPFRTLSDKYKRVLIVGGDGDNLRRVGESYGFKDVVLPMDIIAAEGRKIWPFHRLTPEDQAKYANGSVDLTQKFDAVLIFTDPRDMGADIQIVLDLLLSENGYLGTRRQDQKTGKPAIPIYFSNNDLLWANSYHLPRFGQGSFRIMVEALYKEMTGEHLQSTIIGKPSKQTYEFAEDLLREWGGMDTLGDVYMVGDNPASDIKGANDYGWKSILVRTGVYKDEDLKNGLIAYPTYTYDNILQAVEQVTGKQ
uniref:ARAD1B14696p n=1 Tax=Blastobotrys adeninivorans TaxID=409370 RepID=A0A060T6T5_BLAAD